MEEERKKCKKPPLDEDEIDPSQEEEYINNLLIKTMKEELIRRKSGNEAFIDNCDIETIKSMLDEHWT